MNIIQQLEKEQADIVAAQRAVPEFAPGDTVRVNVKVTEGTRTRVQAYEGVCIGRSGGGLNESFTVRKISYGEGVERVFPVASHYGQRYAYGHVVERERHLIVSAGLGVSGFPVRLGVPPEVVMVEVGAPETFALRAARPEGA